MDPMTPRSPWRRWPRGLPLRTLALLATLSLPTLEPLPTPLAAQQPAPECRCVDAQGITIENCTCLRAFQMPVGAFTLGPDAPRARIGVVLEEHPRGARVAETLPASPAEAAGLEPGDVITRVGGHALTDPLPASDQERAARRGEAVPVERLMVLAREWEPGMVVELEVEREGRTRTVRVETEPEPAPPPAPVRPGWPVRPPVPPRPFEGLGRGEGRLRMMLDSLPATLRLRVDSLASLGPLRFRVDSLGPALRLRVDSLARGGGGAFFRIDPSAGSGAWLGADPLRGAGLLQVGAPTPSPALWPEASARQTTGLPSAGSCGSRPSTVRVFGRTCVEGMSLAPIDPEFGRAFGADGGVLVTDVEANSPLGLRAGDVILSVGGRSAGDADRVAAAIESHRSDDDVTMRVLRRGEELEIRGRRRE